MQLTLNACDDRALQPRYHLFRSAPKLFEDEATLDDNTKIKNGAGHMQLIRRKYFVERVLHKKKSWMHANKSGSKDYQQQEKNK